MSDATKTGRMVRRHGFSLVEILVTLVILLIGVLAILRLFPGGFLTIQRTGEMTGAGAVAKRQMEDQKASLSVVDEIVGVRPDTIGDPTSITLSKDEPRPDSLDDYTADEINNRFAPGFTQTPEAYSNVNQLRRVIGETFRIPTLTPNSVSGAAGAVYLLQFGPVFNKFSTVNNAPSDKINVYGAPLERVLQSSNPDFNGATEASTLLDQPGQTSVPNLLSDTQYAIDYDRAFVVSTGNTAPAGDALMGRIAFYPRLKTNPGRAVPSRTFLIKLKIYAKDSTGQVVVRSTPSGVPLSIIVQDVDPDPLGNLPPAQWRDIDVTPFMAAGDTPLGFRKEAEEVSRKFTLKQAVAVTDPAGMNPTWSNDPYEYAWFSKQNGKNSAKFDANGGVLVFNPIGHNATIQTSTGTRPFVARVDYTTYDNHIIRDERQVPSNAPYDIKLSLPQPLTIDDRLEDQTLYKGLFTGGLDANDVVNQPTPALLIFNEATGEEIQSIANRCLGGNTTPYTVDPKTGVLRLSQALVESTGFGRNGNSMLQNANLRIYYRTQKEYGMQVQKAHSHYNSQAVLTSLANDEFFVGTGAANGTKLYFPRSQGGKSVILGEYYVQTNLTAPGNGLIPVQSGASTVYCRRLDNETYQISTDVDPSLGQSLCSIDLLSQHPEATAEGWTFTPLVTGEAAVNVQGASLKSRVIWRDTTKQVTDPLTGAVRSIPHWRKIDEDTILLPKPIQ